MRTGVEKCVQVYCSNAEDIVYLNYANDECAAQGRLSLVA